MLSRTTRARCCNGESRLDFFMHSIGKVHLTYGFPCGDHATLDRRLDVRDTLVSGIGANTFVVGRDDILE